MAEEEVLAVPSVVDDDSTEAVTNNNNLQFVLKRKLEDMEEPPSAVVADAVALDSSELDTDDGNVSNDADEPSKRPRLDEQASENGHKTEGDNGHTEEGAQAVADVENTEIGADVENAETGADVENAEATVDDEADCDESAKEVIPEEENEPQPVPEVEQKDDAQNGNSEDVDTQMVTPGEAPQEDVLKTSEDEIPDSEVAAGGDSASAGQHPDSGSKSVSKKIEIPNNKVGVLIGKSGDTIKYLQINSGAKIQITRDADADPRAPTRTVELVGAVDSLNKAERLIRDVIAEADAGGSPSLVARGFTAAMTAGSTEVEIPVPGDKVGLIIGRGGDTIRNLQTRSGARIQLIPQNVPGEQGKEKKVKITGDKKQVEVARELIKEVMNQLPGRPSQYSGSNFNQQSYRPHGPGGAPQWGNRGPPNQPMPYDYHQRGPYPSQNQQYPGQSYGNYPYQGPPRGTFGSGWEHRPQAQGPPHSGGHDYYGHVANASAPHSAHMSGHASGPSMAPPHSQGNYNYGQPRGADYAHSTPYSQTAPPAQNYGHGYGDPKYDGQAPVQQPYGGQGYAPQQQGYAPQQQYNRPPPYGMPSQGAPQGYAPPAASQPADTPYQAPVSAAQPYNQNVQPHQQYPYAPGPTTQPPYGSAPVTNDAYAQPQQAAGYPQQGAQPVPVYGQQAGGYAQTAAAPAAGYGQYPQAAQPGYGDQTTAAAATSAAAYGYQGQVDPSAYAAGQAYGAAPAPVAQPGYAQPVATQPGYDQSAQQTGAYATAAAAPTAAPTAYGKTVSPQPGYPPQYDASQQMYAAPR